MTWPRLDGRPTTRTPAEARKAALELWISREQRALGPGAPRPRTYREFRRHARWWELEALRGYDWILTGSTITSSDASAMYARNQRLLSELALLHGSGTGVELLAKSGAELEFPPRA